MSNKTQCPKRFIKTGLLFVFLLIGICIIWKQIFSAGHIDIFDAENHDATALVTAKAKNKINFTVAVNISEIQDTRYLELVNKNHSVKNESENKPLVSAWSNAAVSTNDITIHDTALKAIVEMFTAARETQSFNALYIGSGYRSYDEQKQLYNNAKDKAFVQPPNHSEHHTGLAVDICVLDISPHDMAVSREGKWLAGNSWKYGMLLRYTDDKRKITGIAGEPWHFRYVGQPHAWFCHQNNLCYEEYIQFLKVNKGYQTILNGKTYSVLRQEPQNGIIYVPAHQNYNVSSDNTGGFIVTSWE